MHLSSDEIILLQWGWVNLNVTIITTWCIMLLMSVGSWLISRKLNQGLHIPRWQNALEVVVLALDSQIKEVGLNESRRYLPFIGTLFLFILISNMLSVVPWYEPPTGSMSTTAALAISVFLAVPFFGIREQGLLNYLRSYIKPTPIMLPFNLLGELSRTLALAIRLFGNIMSGAMIIAILLIVTPFIFPVLMNLLHLITGVVQAYIFSILATVYIAAATRSNKQ
ncbi:MAG TPA: F0F1 ATP synthase subunit A [Glaciecola sp.]|nr:F0F1 ATP synthase subunit A [Glaciecola sp.]